MTRPNITPGPWTLRQESHPYKESIATARGDYLLAYVFSARNASNANAKAIAAIPDLLDALEELVSLGSLELPNKRDAALLKATAALTKAGYQF